MSDWFRQRSLYRRLTEYGASDSYPFHMPGHKRQGMVFDNPFGWDITEIDGFDDLHHPEGILKTAMEETARFYGSDASFFLVNGSTCGILAAVSAAVRPGEKILLARNCHKSVYHGAWLRQLKTVYLYPAVVEPFACFGSVNPAQVEEMMKREKNIKAVVLPSPTYEGVVSDIRHIAAVVHRHGAVLIVDEAHGAHFRFHPAFPQSALELGADLVIQSLHKTLPSLTQTALLHVRSDRMNPETIRTYLRMFQSSSPSYVLLASIDQCLRYMTGAKGKRAMEVYVRRLLTVRERISSLRHIRLLDESRVGQSGIYALDPGKIILSAKAAGLGGPALYDRFRKQYRLQPEMCTDTAVTLLTSVNDSRRGFDRLAAAAEAVDRELEYKQSRTGRKWKAADQKAESRPDTDCRTPVPVVQKLSIAQAVQKPSRPVLCRESEGRISSVFIYLYPPGIPLLTPGEQISAACITRMEMYQRQGLTVHGLETDGRIRVIWENGSDESPC